MTLEFIIKTYKTERYKLYSDVFNNTKVSGLLGFPTYLDYFENYLGYYASIDDTEKLITYAVCGLFEYKGKTYVHPHQKIWRDTGGNEKGIRSEVSSEVINSILENSDAFEKALKTKEFNELYEFIKKYKIPKFGGVEIYDSALRIGAKYGISPKEVYLHGSTLIGLKTLETKRMVEEDLSLKKSVKVEELPACFGDMLPIHIEDLLSVKKVDIMKM